MSTLPPVIANPRAVPASDAPALAGWLGETIFSLVDAADARSAINAWPGYAATPLRSLDALAVDLGIGAIHYKDEAERFGLASFKALGGAYAVATLIADIIEERTGLRPSQDAIGHGDHAGIARSITVASATAGNHGRSVAWGAQTFGCSAVIYVHGGVSESRAQAIARYGARVVRVEGDYDESVRVAARDAATNGWTIVSDTSYPGYRDIPRQVMTGYTVMFAEILDQLGDDIPSHVILPGGVGGLAAAAVAYMTLRLGPKRPRFVIVEPEKADCLYQSVLAGAPKNAAGGLGSILLGLDCGEVSLIAWDVLDRLADDFALISDEDAIASLCRLNAVSGIVAGECAAAGLALIANRSNYAGLGLDKASRVLLIGTEGATDPASLRKYLTQK